MSCHKACSISSLVPFLSPYTHLFLGWALISLQPGQSQLREKREVAQHLHFTHTVWQAEPDGVALHYACPTPVVVHWASRRGRPQHWYGKGARATS